MKRLLFACVAAVFPVAASAQDCADANTQREMTECAQQSYQRADDDLNAAYKQASLIAHGYGGAAQEQLLAAQRAWITYRDAACDAEAALYDGGSIQPMVRATCLERLTRARSDDLRAAYTTN